MKLDTSALGQLFRAARSHNGWQSKDVPDSLLHELHDVMKWGPTSVNCWPMRVVFVKSAAAKARLLPCMIEGNVEKTRAAPVAAIIGMDLAFYDKLPALFPVFDARALFVGNQELVNITAMRNGSLQGAYLILAARALGLDCGPMSGFDNAKVDVEFFPGNMVRSNFICALGYGDVAKLHPRGPRPEFDEVNSII
jgi:3-hydroxypropanoate dehydrogenase